MKNSNMWHDIEEAIKAVENEVNKAKQFAQNVKLLTYEDYRVVKAMDWNLQIKVFGAHLTKKGFEEYRTAVIRGGKSKYPIYVGIFRKYNSKLGKALK